MTHPAARIRALAEPVAERHGLDLLEVDVRTGRGSGLVRVTVDSAGGAPLDACQQVSRELSAVLDEEDPIAGRYTLEVSSPGTDWLLKNRRDFERVVGREVDVCFRRGDDAVTQTSGTVAGADDDGVALRSADGNARIAYGVIVWAKQKLPW